MHLTEPEQARRWREAMGFSRQQLAGLIGYSKETVYLMERGTNSVGETVSNDAWRRYKMACLAARVLREYKVKSIDQWGWT